jgi:hypothetical protein
VEARDDDVLDELGQQNAVFGRIGAVAWEEEVDDSFEGQAAPFERDELKGVGGLV